MFKKKPHIKPLAPLRSSDRRKIADQIIADFHLEIPKVDNAPEGEEEAARTSGVGALRNMLLPENTLAARFTTTAGPELKPVSGTIYVGAFGDELQRALWFKLEEKLFPTVYTLWHNAHLVPLLHTPSAVLQKLRGGADLMTPGLIGGPPFPQQARKDAIVAIASDEKPTVPIVVGVCEIDVASLERVHGEKGRAVRGVHWEGDELWAWSTAAAGGGKPPEHIEGWCHERKEEGEQQIAARSAEAGQEQENNGVSLDTLNLSEGALHDSQAAASDVADDAGQAQMGSKGEGELSTKEIDKTFRDAFLYGIYQHKTTNRKDANFGFQFPLSQSYVMSNLVLPFLPIFSPDDASLLQIKKTSWKSARKFIKYLDKELIVKSKDRSGGETVILDIDFEDSAVAGFVPYKLPKMESSTLGAEQKGSNMQGHHIGDESVGQQIRILTRYRPKEKLAPIFEVAGSSVKSLYLPAELRQIITAYVESENLVSASNRRLVNINPLLANAVFDGQSAIDREVLTKGNVPRDTLIDRVIQSCSPFWALLRGDETKDDVKAKAGLPPKIQIVLETRSGNKTVTKVSGVEVFDVTAQSLADELQKACASSTSVNQLVGASPKNPVKEIMVQGPQKDAVIKALEKRGLNKQWINVTDKTKGKKK